MTADVGRLCAEIKLLRDELEELKGWRHLALGTFNSLSVRLDHLEQKELTSRLEIQDLITIAEWLIGGGLEHCELQGVEMAKKRLFHE